MELSKIEKLLEKYLEGETSLEEEKALKAYFSSGNVASHLKEYRVLFGYFESERKTFANEKTFPGTARKSNRKKYYPWFGVAASIAIVVGLFLFRPQSQQSNDLGKIEDPEIALQKTKEVLNMVAQQMNQGKSGLTYLYKIEDTKNELINK